jgi:hypothetical protein
MNTQSPNTAQKFCKCTMPFGNWAATAPIPKNNKLLLPRPPCMSLIYTHFYSWLSSQNLPLLNITRPWGGWELSSPLQFYTHQWYRRQYFCHFCRRNKTHQFHTRRSIIGNQLCNTTIRAVSLKALPQTNGKPVCGVEYVYPTYSVIASYIKLHSDLLVIGWKPEPRTRGWGSNK